MSYNIKQDAVFGGTLTVDGNLIVSGTTTTVNSNNVHINDSIITLNSDETGTPSQNGGLEIERGTETNVQIIWNETTDKLQAGVIGALENVALASDLPGSGDFVDLTTTQTIAGNKTFSANTTFKGNIAVDGLGVDDSTFIFTTSPIRYSAGAVAAVANGNELINKGYVDDGFVNLTSSQTVAGVKTFANVLVLDSGDTSTLEVLSANAGTSRISLQHDANRTFLIYGDDLTTKIRHYEDITVNFNPGSELTMGIGYSQFSHELRVSGDLDVSGVASITAASTKHLTLNATPSGNATIDLERGGVVESRVRSNSNHMLLDYVEGSGGSTSIEMYFSTIEMNKALNVAGPIASTETGAATFKVTAGGSNTVTANHINGNGTQGQWISTGSRTLLRRPVTGDDTDVSLYDTYVDVSKPMTVSDEVTVNATATEPGSIKFQEATNNGSATVSLTGPVATAANTTYRMPDTVGTVGQSMKIKSIVGSVVTMEWA